MFDPFTLALISGAVGGLMNKKDPLKGALLGAGLGYGGGALMGGGGLLGSASAAAPVTEAAITPVAEVASGEALHPFAAQMQQSLMTPASGTNAGLLGTQAPAPVADATINQLSPLTQGMNKFREFSTAAKPFGEAAVAANSIRGLMAGSPQAPIQPSPITPPMPNTASGNMVANMQQQQAERMAREKQLRLQRQQMRGMA